MGLRSWFTFTADLSETLRLARHLDRGDYPVHGVNFIVKLKTPYRKQDDRKYVVAWSGDGSDSRAEAGPFNSRTELLDSMPSKWKGNPESYGTLMWLEDLEALAGNLPQPDPIPMVLDITETDILESAMSEIESQLVVPDEGEPLDDDARNQMEAMLATGRDFLDGKPVDGTSVVNLMEVAYGPLVEACRDCDAPHDCDEYYSEIFYSLKRRFYLSTVIGKVTYGANPAADQ